MIGEEAEPLGTFEALVERPGQIDFELERRWQPVEQDGNLFIGQHVFDPAAVKLGFNHLSDEVSGRSERRSSGRIADCDFVGPRAQSPSMRGRVEVG